MPRIASILVVSCAAFQAACSGLAPLCTISQQRMITETLYFGLAKPNGQVSEEDWRTFLAEVVTPRFPRGLTVWAASGQWKSEAGPIVREPSYILNIVHDGNATADAAIISIVDAYKRKFRQEAVLRAQSSACVSF